MHLEVFAAREDKDQLWHAMRSLQHAMRWDEERFGLEYDLDIYNIVAVRDFNMGAMENKSLTPGSARESCLFGAVCACFFANAENPAGVTAARVS